jgi:hypothetical protein
VRSQLIDKSTAELLGKIALLEELVKTLIERADQSDLRCRQLESQLQRVVSRSQLVTEKQAAELLRVHVDTLKTWRKERPRPRIPHIVYEGGDVRYRVEAIENYLQSRERGRGLRAA